MELLGGLRDVAVFDTEAETIPKDQQVWLIYYGNTVMPSYRRNDWSMTGPQNDLAEHVFKVRCVARTPANRNRLVAAVRQLLIGAILLEGVGPVDEVQVGQDDGHDATMRPTRFETVLGFSVVFDRG